MATLSWPKHLSYAHNFKKTCFSSDWHYWLLLEKPILLLPIIDTTYLSYKKYIIKVSNKNIISLVPKLYIPKAKTIIFIVLKLHSNIFCSTYLSKLFTIHTMWMHYGCSRKTKIQNGQNRILIDNLCHFAVLPDIIVNIFFKLY